MKKNGKDITGATIKASDGDIGKLSEFYFDDWSWIIRYLVIDTGTWLSERKVLLSPDVLLEASEESDVLPVGITKDQVKNSPDIDTNKPVSRQHEEALYKHYAWNAYWATGFAIPAMGAPLYPPPEVHSKEKVENESKGDPNLRSTKKVKGYTVKTIDGDLGDVDDFIIDDRTWRIPYLVIDTGKWLVGKKILLPVNLVKEIDWTNSSVTVNAFAEQLRECPEYDGDEPLTLEFEKQVADHYKMGG